MQVGSIALVLGLLILGACHPRARTVPLPSLCTLPLPSLHRRTPPAALPAALWYALLIKRYDALDVASQRGRAHEAVDCAGEPLGGPPLPASCAPDPDEARLVSAAARDDALVLRHAGGAHWFAWAPLWRRADGSAEGPLALARHREGALEVRALGTVRGYPERARIGVHRVAGRWVLAVEGERCASTGECARAVRLALLERQRFRERPLRAATTHACLAPAWLPLREALTLPIAPHAERGLVRELAVAFRPDGIVVDEHIAVRDRDLRHGAGPGRLFREAQSRLRIRPEAGELLTEGQSLWDPIRAQDAALDAEAP